jgi:UDP-glucuronate decarboxylase
VALTRSASQIVYAALPQDDPTQRQPDITKAKEILGWQPKVALDDGLKHTVEFFRKGAG